MAEKEVIYLSHGARGLGGKRGAWFVVKNAKTLGGLGPSMAEVIGSLLDRKRLVFEITIIPQHPERVLARAITDVDEVS